MTVVAKKISKGSLFKLMFIGLTLGTSVFFIGCSVGALFGMETVQWENQPVVGIKGLALGIAMWPFFTFFLTVFMWVFVTFGLWLYSFVRPLELTFQQPLESSSRE